MAPTVYFADISPLEIDTESDEELPHRQQIPSFIVEYGIRDLRLRRRPPIVEHGRHLRRLMSEASRHPTSRDSKAQALPVSIDNNSLCSILTTEPASLDVKTMTRSCPSRVLLLKRRKGLLDITLRTVALIRRNQQLQLRLTALQAETRAFIKSVMSNPENRGVQLTTARSLEAREDEQNRDTEDGVDK